MKQYNRRVKFDELKKYCHFANENDFIEICEWSNGEGFDVDISGKKHMSLTHGEFQAMCALVNMPFE